MTPKEPLIEVKVEEIKKGSAAHLFLFGPVVRLSQVIDGKQRKDRVLGEGDMIRYFTDKEKANLAGVLVVEFIGDDHIFVVTRTHVGKRRYLLNLGDYIRFYKNGETKDAQPSP